MTWRSGCASCAPIAAGSSKPIVEKPPDVRWVRGARVTQRCLTMPCGRPAPGDDDRVLARRRLDLADRAGHRHRRGVEPDLISTCSNHAAFRLAISRTYGVSR